MGAEAIVPYGQHPCKFMVSCKAGDFFKVNGAALHDWYLMSYRSKSKVFKAPGQQKTRDNFQHLKENITMRKPYNPFLYRKIIKKCALECNIALHQMETLP